VLTSAGYPWYLALLTSVVMYAGAGQFIAIGLFTTGATIPEAAAAAVEAFDKPPVLVTGGTDKNLDFGPLVKAASRAKAIILLEGTGSAKLKPLLESAGLSCLGPFGVVDEAVNAAIQAASPGDTVVLSPGCTSFGMFLNEFDRGRKWKEAVIRLTGGDHPHGP
jgi:UDP-N-acetylmuramoylalanine--D-glutamate ligase